MRVTRFEMLAAARFELALPKRPFFTNPSATPGGGNAYGRNRQQQRNIYGNHKCYECGGRGHHARNCTNHAVMTPQGQKLPMGQQKGKFRTFRRVKRFNYVGVYVGLEDIPVMYGADNDTYEDLPDPTHCVEEESDQFNIVNQNRVGNEYYLSNRLEDLDLLGDEDVQTRAQF